MADDYIRKQQAIGALEADFCHGCGHEGKKCRNCGAGLAIGYIRSIPAESEPGGIRCGRCAHWSGTCRDIDGERYALCDIHWGSMPESYYCGSAVERKEE